MISSSDTTLCLVSGETLTTRLTVFGEVLAISGVDFKLNIAVKQAKSEQPTT